MNVWPRLKSFFWNKYFFIQLFTISNYSLNFLGSMRLSDLFLTDWRQNWSKTFLLPPTSWLLSALCRKYLGKISKFAILWKTKFKYFFLFRFSKKPHPSLNDYYQCTTIGNYETEEMVSLSKITNFFFNNTRWIL